jgi:hypothetical protein
LKEEETMHAVRLQYSARPMMLPMYLGGLIARRSGLNPRQPLPQMRSEWRGFTMDPRQLARFLKICGLAPSDTMPLVYPLVFTFPLHVGIIAHRAFPILYARMMQIRNHVLQYRQVKVRETLDISVELVSKRIAVKGLEVDVHTALEAADGIVWESVHTYFFPGRFGEPDPVSPLAEFPILPEPHEETTWTMPRGGGFCFGLMAGDYNALHYLSPYARRMGFERTFAHAQFSLALCMRHLPGAEPDRPVRLDAAIKGPVYFGRNVLMKHAVQGQGRRFDLYCADNPRPCITGLYESAEPDFEMLRDTYALVQCQ